MVNLASLSLIPAVAGAPLKVFLMAGQSNMQGHGHISDKDDAGNFKPGTLEAVKSDFVEVLASDGSWIVRDDVIISTLDQGGRTGSLSVGFGGEETSIGMELTFGIRLAETLGERVLLIKSAWGGSSLSCDFRPPSAVAARGTPFPTDQDCELVTLSSGKQSGVYFKLAADNFRKVLKKLPEVVPDYSSEDGYQIEAFEWHQGWNDCLDYDENTQNMATEYENNLQDFIKDMRSELSDLDSSDWPFVVGASGQGGSPKAPASKHTDDELGDYITQGLRVIWRAGMRAQTFEGAGTVISVDSVPFYREEQDSPGTEGYHYWNNAEFYLRFGRAMADATLSRAPSDPPPPAPSPGPSPGPLPDPTPSPDPPSPGPSPTGSCEDQCARAGHCCTDHTSNAQHPSCAMGCLISRELGSVQDCKAKCLANDNTCDSWDISGKEMNNCGDCPCSTYTTNQECSDGCEFGFASSQAEQLLV